MKKNSSIFDVFCDRELPSSFTPLHVFHTDQPLDQLQSSMFLHFYYLTLYQNEAFVMSLCMQLHFSGKCGKYHVSPATSCILYVMPDTCGAMSHTETCLPNLLFLMTALCIQ